MPCLGALPWCIPQHDKPKNNNYGATLGGINIKINLQQPHCAMFWGMFPEASLRSGGTLPRSGVCPQHDKPKKTTHAMLGNKKLIKKLTCSSPTMPCSGACCHVPRSITTFWGHIATFWGVSPNMTRKKQQLPVPHWEIKN